MSTSPQQTVFDAMGAADFYPRPVSRLETRETHISKVFLTGEEVYKVKKAVTMPFLDFSDLADRRRFCEAEVRLNRRLAPDIYLGVTAITRDGDRYVPDGDGPPVEYAVRMRQLPEDRSLLRMLREERVTPHDLDALARVLAEFYTAADPAPEFGEWDLIRKNCEDNFTALAPFGDKWLDPRSLEIVRAATRAFLFRKRALFDHRRDQGGIRDCHGDLKAEHIYFLDGVRIIDCIEFSAAFRCQDIASDLAFLMLDLDFENFSAAGRRLLDTYAELAKDPDIYAMIDFYKCYRAMVRCKVTCLRRDQKTEEDSSGNGLIRQARKYLNLAYGFARRFTRPTLWVTCGMPASGKSTIAEKLAESLGVTVHRSDAVRKSLFGEKTESPEATPAEGGIYSGDATSLTYGRLLMRAQETLAEGRSVILDATFSRQHQRDEALRLARDMDANLIFVECISPDPVLKARLEKREHGDGLSDARRRHFAYFKKKYEPVQTRPDLHHIRVDTSRPPAECLKTILSRAI